MVVSLHLRPAQFGELPPDHADSTARASVLLAPMPVKGDAQTAANLEPDP
jgi:hypothetical protein